MRFLNYNGTWKKGGKEVLTFPVSFEQRKLSIPLEVAEEAYKEYLELFGESQSLERLGERGGFGAAEIALLFFERCKRIEMRRDIEKNAHLRVNADLIQERNAVQGENAEYVRKWIDMFSGRQGDVVHGILKMANEAIQWRNERDELKKKLQELEA